MGQNFLSFSIGADMFCRMVICTFFSFILNLPLNLQTSLSKHDVALVAGAGESSKANRVRFTSSDRPFNIRNVNILQREVNG